jgi:hypothetical protein
MDDARGIARRLDAAGESGRGGEADTNGDFIATVRRADAGTVFVRTYQVSRSCPPAVAIETSCTAANITRKTRTPVSRSAYRFR